MRSWRDLEIKGKPQTVFITGEAGIGKTTLVQAFLKQAEQVAGTIFVRGQCLEHFGSGEAYLPVLDGFSRLCRASADEEVVKVLRENILL
jgi:predicted ATPase